MINRAVFVLADWRGDEGDAMGEGWISVFADEFSGVVEAENTGCAGYARWSVNCGEHAAVEDVAMGAIGVDKDSADLARGVDAGGIASAEFANRAWII